MRKRVAVKKDNKKSAANNGQGFGQLFNYLFLIVIINDSLTFGYKERAFGL
jgi:hypothetical protein